MAWTLLLGGQSWSFVPSGVCPSVLQACDPERAPLSWVGAGPGCPLLGAPRPSQTMQEPLKLSCAGRVERQREESLVVGLAVV